jgi:hypothetical protein
MDDVMPATDQLLNDVRLRGLSRDVALDCVVGFAQQFGEAHLTLACHAAFPLVLTPDLLYRLWANFVPQAPWRAVADVLLSPLCREVGYELYEMDVNVRNLLLKELEEDERFGQQRLNELADSLTEYVAQQLQSDNSDIRDLAQAQRWTALAYTRPSEVAYELAKVLSELVAKYSRKHEQEYGTDLIRVTSLVETLAEPLNEFRPLLAYARDMANLVRGDLKVTTNGTSSIPEQVFTPGTEADRARAQLEAVLELLRTLHAGREVALFVEQRRPRVTVSTRLGEFGWGALTVGMLNTIFIAPQVLDLTAVQAIRLYAHEFGHLLFGRDRPVECTIDSIEQEYVSESLAARIWAEMNPDAPSEEYERQAGWILDQPKGAAYQAIRQWGSYYATLPEKQPRWYQTWRYWPAVRHILRIALGI